MVWGRSHAKRACPPRDADVIEREAPAELPPVARCAKCDTPVIMAGGKLPKDWVEKDGVAYCPDDAPAPAPRQRRICGKRRHVDIGPKGVRYTGCRIGSEIVHGMAELDIRAGASPPPGRDERVRFLLDGPALDDLIIELSAIRRGLPHG